MAIDFRAELAFMFRDAGVPVVFGAQSTHGIFVEVGEVIFETSEGPVLATVPTLKVEADALTDLDRDETIIVQGVEWTINTSRPIGDGSITMIELRKTS